MEYKFKLFNCSVNLYYKLYVNRKASYTSKYMYTDRKIANPKICESERRNNSVENGFSAIASARID